jgi:hypothetical protein
MLFRLSKALVVAALVFSLGLHWMFLQSVAWVGMIVAYSQHGSLTEAVAKTFSGQHPCTLCKVVQEGKNSEKKQEAPAPTIKFDYLFVSLLVSLYPPVIEPLHPSTPGPVPLRLLEPPSPPPEILHG